MQGSAADLVLIADKQTRIRPALHKEVRNRLVREIGKTLTKASISDIEKSLK
jgi:protein required for attachment to host cells